MSGFIDRLLNPVRPRRNRIPEKRCQYSGCFETKGTTKCYRPVLPGSGAVNPFIVVGNSEGIYCPEHQAMMPEIRFSPYRIGDNIEGIARGMWKRRDKQIRNN